MKAGQQCQALNKICSTRLKLRISMTAATRVVAFQERHQKLTKEGKFFLVLANEKQDKLRNPKAAPKI